MKLVKYSDLHSSESGSELEHNSRAQEPDQLLSTFTPNESNVLGETDIEWTVRLESKDVGISLLIQVFMNH